MWLKQIIDKEYWYLSEQDKIQKFKTNLLKNKDLLNKYKQYEKANETL
jgi:hypothetical protein